ncbi:DUF1565 domain-containing protein [bacterium]|nr:DUF1565 domain-containing protein [bacterium]
MSARARSIEHPLRDLSPLAAAVLATVLGAILAAAPVRAAVLSVPAGHPTITSALAAAAAGDTVEVAPGTYAASTNGETFPLIVTTAGVWLRAGSGGEVVLDAEGSSRVVQLNAAGNVRLSGFTITGGVAVTGGGVHVPSGTPEIDHNFVLGNGASIRGAGIMALSASAPWIHHNVVWNSFDTDTTDAVDPHGVLLQDDALGIVEHNLIGRTDGNGLLTSANAQPIVRHNVFLENGQTDPVRGRGICWLADTAPIVTHNLFFANEIAAILWPGGGGNLSGTESNDFDANDDVYGNLDGDPLLVDPDTFLFQLTASSPAIDAGDPLLPLDPDGTVADLGPFYFDQNTSDAPLTAPAPRLAAAPNPFRAGTRILLGNARARDATVDILDVTGRRVRSLRTGGAGAVEWDGRDTAGRPVATGVYLARVNGEGVSGEPVRLIRIR